MRNKYVAYYRVSTQKQGESGLGLGAQRKAAEEFIQAYGGEVITEFVEVESGKREDRPEFTKAADYAELANASVLVAKLDRLSRDLHFITSLQKRGIRFKLCDLPDIDQLTIHILAAMAEHEARMISIRTKQALEVAKANGTVLGNPHLNAQRNLAVGAANERRTDKQKDWRAKIQKIIQHIEESCDVSTCEAIANELNRRGLSTYRGGPFTLSIVSRIKRQSINHQKEDL